MTMERSSKNSSVVSKNDVPLGDDFFFKFILIGDAGVGKTAILQRYLEGTFLKEYRVTVGAEFGSKFVQVDDQHRVKLQIWDTAGQESFSSIVKSFYKEAHGVFLVYNVNKRSSFENLEKWMNNVKEDVDPNVLYVLIGNQVDQESKREVSYEEGLKFMHDHGTHFFFETSAAKGINIDLAFAEAAKFGFMSYLRAMKEGQESLFEPKREENLSLKSKRLSKTSEDSQSCAC